MSLVHRTQSVSAVFCHSFTTGQVLKTTVSYEYQKNECIQQWNLFKHQRSTFNFSHIVQIYLNTYWHTLVRLYERWDCCDRCISRQNNTSARSFSSTKISRLQANFLHQTCIAGLV